MIYFSKAIESDVNNKNFYANRSACYIAKGLYKLALKDALKSIELDKNYFKGYYRAALSYYEMEEYNDALKIITQMKEMSDDTQNKEIHNLESNILMKHKEHEELLTSNYDVIYRIQDIKVLRNTLIS
jgi:DnaJ family protein C protein 7